MNHKQGIDRLQMQFVCLEDYVDHDSFARAIDLVVDTFPLEQFGFEHVNLQEQGNEPYHPSVLLKLLLYGQRHGIRSARKLARQCQIINDTSKNCVHGLSIWTASKFSELRSHSHRSSSVA